MNKRTADVWAWIVGEVTGETPVITQVPKSALRVANMPSTPLRPDYRVDFSGLTEDEAQEARRLLRGGYTKEQVAAALIQARNRG